MARLADPIHAGFENHLYEGGKISYPDPANRYSLGSRILLESPDVAKVSCDQPKIVSAVEELLGGRAVLSQYQSYLSPPGYVNSGSTTHTAGHGTHCTPRPCCADGSLPLTSLCADDYKPFRPVGSFLSFLFAVVPLSDYTPDAGPLLLAPGKPTSPCARSQLR